MDVPEYESLLGELETRVDRLRALYEQYFMGIERQMPLVPHKDVERRIATLRREQPRNTALRFRFQMVVQRYNTYQPHWQRICRQIEEGTYKRDVLRAKKKFGDVADVAEAKPKGAAKEVAKEAPQQQAPVETLPPKSVEVELELDLEEPAPRPAPPIVAKEPTKEPEKPRPGPAKIEVPRVALPGAKPGMVWRRAGEAAPDAPNAAAPTAPAAQKPPVPVQAKPGPPPTPVAKPAVPAGPRPGPPPSPIARPAAEAKPPAPAPAKPAAPAAKPGDLSDQRVRELYAKYVDAKRARNESTAGITFESMAKSLRDSSDKLKQKHAGRAVDFEIGEKDGKTVIKPVVK